MDGNPYVGPLADDASPDERDVLALQEGYKVDRVYHTAVRVLTATVWNLLYRYHIPAQMVAEALADVAEFYSAGPPEDTADVADDAPAVLIV
jgi:hypothetical protein